MKVELNSDNNDIVELLANKFKISNDNAANLLVDIALLPILILDAEQKKLFTYKEKLESKLKEALSKPEFKEVADILSSTLDCRLIIYYEEV